MPGGHSLLPQTGPMMQEGKSQRKGLRDGDHDVRPVTAANWTKWRESAVAPFATQHAEDR